MAKKSSSSTEANTPAIGEPGYFFSLVSRGVRQVFNNPGPALVFIVVYALASIASQLFQPGLTIQDEAYKPFENIVSIVFVATVPLYMIHVARKESFDISDFTYINPKLFFYALGTSILFGVAIILSIFALVVPVIWALGWFALALYVCADEELPPFAAMRASRELSKNHKRYVWGATVITLLYSVPLIALALIPYAGSVTLPLISMLGAAVYANLYIDLKAQA